MKGRFITFEGVEGCGKTTQIERLRQYLTDQGFSVVTTREPGGTPIAENIRNLLLDPDHHAMSPMVELLLYEAARAQHVDERIRPALESGAIVLCDRFADSTTAYQGGGRGLPLNELAHLHHIATREVWPDLTLLIDLPVEEGLQRARTRGRADRMEQQAVAFHESVRAGFLELARHEPARIKVINGAQSIEAIANDVRGCVDVLLNAKEQTA